MPVGKDLAPIYRQLGAEFDSMIDRTTRRHRRQRIRTAITLGGAAAVLLGCGAGGALLLIDDDSPVQARRGQPTFDAPATPPRLSPTVDDPAGGAPWAVRAYRSATGKVCVAAGQVAQGRLGVVEGGVLRPLPVAAREVCVSPKPQGVTTVLDRPSGRTLVYGVAGSNVDAVDVTAQPPKRRRVPRGPYGAFIYVVPGTTTITGVSPVVR